MKKYKIPLLIVVALLLVGMFSTQSCRKISDFTDEDFISNEFYEIENLTDEMWIDGSVAVPLINSTFKLSDFIPELDSSFWVEIDPSTNPDDEYYQLMHLRMYFKDIATVKASQIYDGVSPGNEGDIITANTFSMRTDTSKLKLYENALSGHLFFYNPQFTFKFKNEIPITTHFNLDSLLFYSENMDSMLSSTPHIAYTINNPEVSGTYENTDIVVDRESLGVLPEIFSPIPKFLSFFISVGSETDQTLPYNLTGEEKISLDVDIDVPMKLKLDSLVLGDTVKFDFASDTNNIEQIKAITVKLMFDNMIPAGGLMEINFHDENNEGIISELPVLTLDNQGEEFFFAPAITDEDGESTSSVKSSFTIYLDQDQLAELKRENITTIVVKGTFNSDDANNDQYVKILSTNTLGIKLGIRVDYGGSTGDIP